MNLEKGLIRSVIADLRTSADVLRIPPQFQGGFSEAEFLRIGGILGAVWRHNGDSSRPHVVLAGKEHSDTYFNMRIVLSCPNLTTILAGMLIEQINKHTRVKPDWIVGSGHTAALLVREVGRQMEVRSDFCDKDLSTGQQRWSGLEIDEEEEILQVEDLITTNYTTARVRWGIKDNFRHSLHFLPVIGTIVLRRDPRKNTQPEFEGSVIVPVFSFKSSAWTGSQCPLCREGSKALPHGKQHWAELTAT